LPLFFNSSREVIGSTCQFTMKRLEETYLCHYISLFFHDSIFLQAKKVNTPDVSAICSQPVKKDFI
jgi:hypothetical protein